MTRPTEIGTDAALAESADERVRRARRQRRFLARRGLVEQSAVLGDDVLEQVEARADLLQIDRARAR